MELASTRVDQRGTFQSVFFLRPAWGLAYKKIFGLYNNSLVNCWTASYGDRDIYTAVVMVKTRYTHETIFRMLSSEGKRKFSFGWKKIKEIDSRLDPLMQRNPCLSVRMLALKHVHIERFWVVTLATFNTHHHTLHIPSLFAPSLLLFSLRPRCCLCATLLPFWLCTLSLGQT